MELLILVITFNDIDEKKAFLFHVIHRFFIENIRFLSLDWACSLFVLYRAFKMIVFYLSKLTTFA